MGLGWKFSVIPSSGAPESVQDAWKTAVRRKPSAVFTSGWPKTVFPAQLAQLAKMKIPVFQYATLDPAGGGITLSVGGAKDVAIIGRVQAAWVTVRTAGKAHVLLVGLPAFEILKPIRESFKTNLKALCAGCTVDSLDLPITSLGVDAVDRIVSYVRSHSDINYIVYDYDGIGIGVPAGLKAAGLTDRVGIIGEAPSAENISYIAAGTQSATIAQGYYELWASLVDAAARVITGQNPEADHVPVPYYLYTKNSPPSQTGDKAPIVPNLYQQFLALWPK
jgi:ribose transport system substrate-binding protein